jgi:hypothetical protein
MSDPRRRAGKLRKLTALIASLGLLVLGTFALATDAYAIQFDCSVRWVKFYPNYDTSGSVRWYCASGDVDMSSEPGNVMGPLGNGTGGTVDDYDSANGTSGISSLTWKDSSGNYTLCVYDGTNYTGDILFVIGQFEGSAHWDFQGSSFQDNKASSFKIVFGDASNCPNYH